VGEIDVFQRSLYQRKLGVVISIAALIYAKKGDPADAGGWVSGNPLLQQQLKLREWKCYHFATIVISRRFLFRVTLPFFAPLLIMTLS
jgi:hypothetical protein